MNKITILAMTILIAFSMGILYSNITRTEASNIVMSNVVAASEGNVQVYATQTTISGSILTVTSKHTLSLPYSSNWVFFIDDMVFADWGHPCRYVFVNALNGNFQIVNEQYYPVNLNEYDVVSGLNMQLIPNNPEITAQNRTFRSVNPRLYAILVNGMSGQYYWNNVSSMFCLMTQQYGFDPANIIVLSTDNIEHINLPYENCPLDLDGDESPDVDGPAYHTNLDNAFGAISNLMTSPDRPNPENNQFFFYYSGHGNDANSNTGISFALSEDGDLLPDSNDEYITVQHFAQLMNSLPSCQQIVGLTQCYSGGFIPSLSAPNRIILTSASDTEPSFNECVVTGYYNEAISRWYPRYNEFFYYYTAAMWGWYPSVTQAWMPWSPVGDFDFTATNYGNPQCMDFYFPNHPTDVFPDNIPFGNGDGIVQLSDAYNYARYYDIASKDVEGLSTFYPGYTYFNNTNCYQNPQPPNQGRSEHPMINSIAGLQSSMTLSGIGFKSNGQRSLFGNVLLSKEGIEILSGGQLTIDPNSKIYLPDESRIIVRAGASISIGNNVTFIGVNPSVGEVQGNRIEVYGNITMGSSVRFISESGHTWDGLYINNSQALSLSNLQITNCKLEKTGGSLSLQNVICDSGYINGLSTVINLSGSLILNNGSRLVVDAVSTLDIAHNATISGNVATLPPSAINPNGVFGSRMEVYGNMTVDRSVTFTSEPGYAWDGLYHYANTELSLYYAHFTNCKLYKQTGDLNISCSTFVNAPISCYNGTFRLENCPTVSGITCGRCNSVIIRNTTENIQTISGSSDGIRLKECEYYEISGYNITGNAGCGIEISETFYGIGRQNIIKNCTIINNSDAGIRFYHASGLVEGCIIGGNDKGIVAFRSSVVEIRKNRDSAPYYGDSCIYNNTWQEILFDDKSDIMMDDGRNIVSDSQYEPGTFDQYLVQCYTPMTRSRNFVHNKWRSNSQGMSIMPQPERFDPPYLNPEGEQIGYILDPLYEPGIPREVTPENDEVIYYSAINEAMDENIEGAIYMFKSIISQYPESEYAPASAKNLLALEQDKQALMNYYHTEPNLHWNGDIGKLADYLENYCHIKMGDYQAAITWFEAVISDPPCELDSLMAIIDLGYVYLLMQENAPKAAVSCLYPQFKPNFSAEYEQNTENILLSLKGPRNNTENQGSNSNSSTISVPVLQRNYPNPFNPSTSISFSLPKEMQCNLEIFNVKGQKVKTLSRGKQSFGEHKITWNGYDDNGNPVSSGMYFYKLVTPDKVITNKMIMLK